MNDDAQILIARLLTHQTLRRDDKMVKRALSDDQFRAEVDKRLLEGLREGSDAVDGGGLRNQCAVICHALRLR